MHQELYQKLGYDFLQPSWLVEALTHKSAMIAGTKNVHDYQRLEFVGDAILGLAIAEALFSRYPTANEGQLTHWRANLVNREFLANVAKRLGLQHHLVVGEDKKKLHENISVLSDIMEAVIAAVYFDGGWEKAQAVVLRLFDKHLDGVAQWGVNKDPKSQLQEDLQARKWPLPTYSLILKTGPQHRPNFIVQAQLPSFHSPDENAIFSALGEGASRKEAERNAAEKVLTYLQSVDMVLEG